MDPGPKLRFAQDDGAEVVKTTTIPQGCHSIGAGRCRDGQTICCNGNYLQQFLLDTVAIQDPPRGRRTL
ncbi:hypothetical protein [Bosea vaviloviae]|uniref:Uncharacterized protein n=1 Tax=Bosea vaviloviae TaxID=1526658 RepID=A0A1D7U249_9HYPH|nr:hypothetical protein [Bosea vaviloviae]AOO81440.1 hypothetical protein BHK69_14110 [Bosea vaviloviae]